MSGVFGEWRLSSRKAGRWRGRKVLELTAAAAFSGRVRVAGSSTKMILE